MKKKVRCVQKKKSIDAPCKINIMTVVEDHASSENVTTF